MCRISIVSYYGRARSQVVYVLWVYNTELAININVFMASIGQPGKFEPTSR